MSKKWAIIYIICFVIFLLQIKIIPENENIPLITVKALDTKEQKLKIDNNELQKQLEKLKLENKNLKSRIKMKAVCVISSY